MKSFDLLTYLQRLPRLQLILLCIVLTGIVACIDWVTGPNLSTSIFYLLPISLAAWFVNRRTGLIFSFIDAVLWFVTDYLTNPDLTIWAIPFWNAMVRLGFFVTVVFSLTAVRRGRQRQEDLMAFVVHDLRAPLGNMLTALDMLHTKAVSENLDGTWQELVNLGLSSGRRMLILVDSLLDLSRLESGKVKVQPDTVLIADLFAESIDQIVLTAEFKKVNILQSLEPAAAAVYADPSLTQRILINLLNNAIKFSPQQGTITLSAAAGQHDEVIIAVHDEGAGIPEEWQQRVFAKYGQVSGARSGGSGLGLTFCKLAVEAQNGRIWLESETGRGTTLSIALPAVNIKDPKQHEENRES